MATYVTKMIHQANTQKFGGFRLYWKLYLQLWIQAHSMSKTYPIKGLYLRMAIKTPWWLFIKPLGQLISHTTTIDGDFSWRNGVFEKMDARKFRSWKFCGISLIRYPSTITAKDLDSLRPLTDENR